MTCIEERISQIESTYAHLLRNVLVVNLTEETFRLILGRNDGTNLRVAERWRGRALVRYSYYWLDAEDRLKVGWDNAPHHPQLETFPHHKPIDGQENRVLSASGGYSVTLSPQ